jgi:DNA-3-methyladenine glycosylase II
VSRLCELDGIGRWSAEYIMLRGFGRVNIFPGDDIGARNKLRRWLSIATPLDYPAVGSVVGRWRPYAGLVYFHLLLDSLAHSGWLTADPPPVAQAAHS